MNDLERRIYDLLFDKIIYVDDDGLKSFYKDELDSLNLNETEKNFVLYVLRKNKIKIIDDDIRKMNRSHKVSEHDYGDVVGHNLQKKDQNIMSMVDYGSVNQMVFEDFSELDEYLEKRFIPAYISLKRRKGKNGEVEYYPSINLFHIVSLRLSEVEFEYVMNYFKTRNIVVRGKGATLTGEFDNYDYVTTYKSSALPEFVSTLENTRKFIEYKKSNDPIIREEIIKDNMRLVPFVISKYISLGGVDNHVLESYGYEGLIMAVDRYDVDSGYSFSALAIPYIKGCIYSGIKVELGKKRDKSYYVYKKVLDEVESEYDLSLEENPYLVEVVLDKLINRNIITEDGRKHARNKIMILFGGIESLDEVVDEIEEVMDDITLGDTVATFFDYDDFVSKSILRDIVNNALDTLSEDEQRVINLRYGFLDGKCYTLKETAKIVGKTIDSVRGIEARALRNLKHPSKSKEMRSYYLDTDENYKHGR